MTGLPTYQEFRALVPAVDWERIRFELDFSRRLAFGGGAIPLSSRLYGVAFALRMRVPSGTGQFAKGHGHWCWPWQWHARYYAELGRLRGARPTPPPRSVAGAIPVPLGPEPPRLTPEDARRMRRFAVAMKRYRRALRLRRPPPAGDAMTEGDETHDDAREVPRGE